MCNTRACGKVQIGHCCASSGGPEVTGDSRVGYLEEKMNMKKEQNRLGSISPHPFSPSPILMTQPTYRRGWYLHHRASSTQPRLKEGKRRDGGRWRSLHPPGELHTRVASHQPAGLTHNHKPEVCMGGSSWKQFCASYMDVGESHHIFLTKWFGVPVPWRAVLQLNKIMHITTFSPQFSIQYKSAHRFTAYSYLLLNNCYLFLKTCL